MAILISEKNITDAYIATLENLLSKKIHPYHVVSEIIEPIVDGKLNFNKKCHELFEDHELQGEGKERWKGRQWIKNRINVLCPQDMKIKPNKREVREPNLRTAKNSSYFDRLTKYGMPVCVKGEKVESIDQLNCVATRFWSKKHVHKTIVGNYLTCVLVDPRLDLYSFSKFNRAQVGKTAPPCLTLIDFKDEGDRLHLFAVFRSQFFDTKAYGNWISLAILLQNMCGATDYKPGKIVSVALKALFKVEKDAADFLEKVKPFRAQT